MQLQVQSVINMVIKLRPYCVQLQVQPVINMGIKLRPYCAQLQVQPVINMGYNCVATVYGRSGTVLQNYEALLTLSATNYLVKIFLHFSVTRLSKHIQYLLYVINKCLFYHFLKHLGCHGMCQQMQIFCL